MYTIINSYANISSREEVQMKIKDYIEERGLSGGKVARKLGITRSYFNQIVNCRKIPSLHLAKKIEAFCEGKVKASDLLGLK